MVQTIVLLAAAVSLVFLAVLAVSARRHPGWVEHVRHHARAHAATRLAAREIEEPVRHSAEGAKIASAWEQERSRAALLEATGYTDIRPVPWGGAPRWGAS